MRRLALVVALAACGAKHETAAPAPDARVAAPVDAGAAEAARRDELRRQATEIATAVPVPHDASPDQLPRPVARDAGSDLQAELDRVLDSGVEIRVGGAGTPDAAQVEVGDVSVAQPTSLTADMISRKVTSVYRAGLRRCRRDNPVTGKALVHLTVNQTGRATAVDVTADSAGFATCVQGQARNWRFPAADADSDVTITLLTDRE